MTDATPRRFQWLIPTGERHPNGSDSQWRNGCYFPATGLAVTDMGERGTGVPSWPGLHWTDEPPAGAPTTAHATLTRYEPTIREMLNPADPGKGTKTR